MEWEDGGNPSKLVESENEARSKTTMAKKFRREYHFLEVLGCTEGLDFLI